MILHIGNGKTLQKKQIIGIFDIDAVSNTASGRDFLNKKQKEGRVSYSDSDLPRSFLVCATGEVYLSRISTPGLKARINTPIHLAEE